MIVKALLITGMTLAALVLLLGGPFAGYLIQRHERRLLAREFVKNGVVWGRDGWHETSEMPKLTVARPGTQELAVTHEDEHPLPPLRAQATVGLPLDTLALTRALTARTESFKTLEYVDGILEEAECAGDAAFRANPLDSWCMPPVLDTIDYLPLADEAFAALVVRDALTGIGADIGAEWADWNLYESADR